MKNLRNYIIPRVGHFSLEQVEEGDEEKLRRSGANGIILPPGFCGAQGIMTMTEVYKTQEEAESALVDAILKDLQREEEGLGRRMGEITEVKAELKSNSLKNYQTPKTE